MYFGPNQNVILRLVWRRFLERVSAIDSEVAVGARLALKSGRQLHGSLVWNRLLKVLEKWDRRGHER